jgi:hypothetical protein
MSNSPIVIESDDEITVEQGPVNMSFQQRLNQLADRFCAAILHEGVTEDDLAFGLQFELVRKFISTSLAQLM